VFECLKGAPRLSAAWLEVATKFIFQERLSELEAIMARWEEIDGFQSPGEYDRFVRRIRYQQVLRGSVLLIRAMGRA
jgi:hypothetical protein